VSLKQAAFTAAPGAVEPAEEMEKDELRQLMAAAILNVALRYVLEKGHWRALRCVIFFLACGCLGASRKVASRVLNLDEGGISRNIEAFREYVADHILAAKPALLPYFLEKGLLSGEESDG
jgi:hypothetical protein